MKTILIPLALVLCSVALLTGCSEQKAQKEYERILVAETAGTDQKTLISEYEALIGKSPETSSAAKARERVDALKTKLENDAKAAQIQAEKERAEKEYKRILDAELAGGDAKALISEYQKLIDQHPDAPAATGARERLLVLKTKIENEAKVAQLKAEQEERERIQNQKEREALEAEVKRQKELLVLEMTTAVTKAALKLRIDTKVEKLAPYGEAKTTDDFDRRIWTLGQVYMVSLRGTLLGLSTYSEIIECTGEIRLNEVTKQFERTVNAKPATAN